MSLFADLLAYETEQSDYYLSLYSDNAAELITIRDTLRDQCYTYTRFNLWDAIKFLVLEKLYRMPQLGSKTVDRLESTDTVLGFDPNHAFKSNPDPVYDFNHGPVFNFGPGPGYQCYTPSHFEFRNRSRF
ncbi:hypothetical protein EVAR_38278_1 [Eumeta japonica]|uniref:Uncharacterized protein n=1 Tax=Eumeta variegata TaxID=151549 RepID=A0A4C1WAJ2_EUMVA|nr:hypothetical protein EVAR_38278_1 [Eumeta japonica]